MPIPDARATNADLEHYLGVGDDTRRAILRALGLVGRRSCRWSEIWAAVGLDPDQPEELWPELMLCPKRRNQLWDAARVGEEIGCAADTVHKWCRTGKSPEGFPRPLIDFSPKTQLWLPLAVQAYDRPSLYGDMASRIRRKPLAVPKPRSQPIAYHGTLQPLPPRDGTP